VHQQQRESSSFRPTDKGKPRDIEWTKVEVPYLSAKQLQRRGKERMTPLKTWFRSTQ
jgi:hypothetical protein